MHSELGCWFVLQQAAGKDGVTQYTQTPSAPTPTSDAPTAEQLPGGLMMSSRTGAPEMIYHISAHYPDSQVCTSVLKQQHLTCSNSSMSFKPSLCCSTLADGAVV